MSLLYIRNYSILAFFLLVSTNFCKAQQADTLSLTLKGTEETFLKNNLDLLIQQTEIEQSRAEIITAKLFENPELSYENLFYNHETKKFLETSYATGQFNAQISKLFKLAGKRNKSIKLANAGVKIAEYEYYDLLRTLKFELRTTFYQLHYKQQSLNVYNQQINSLKQLLNVSQLQLKAGNISQKEILRIKSMLYRLQGEKNNLEDEIDDLQKSLKIFLNVESSNYIKAVANKEDANISVQKINYVSLIDSAKVNRADLNRAKSESDYAALNLKLQKALAVPDLQLGLSYDLKGSYPEKYTGIGVSIPLPLFNRNQGEIKKAKIAIDASQLTIQRQELLIKAEVQNSYNTALRAEKLFESFDPSFTSDLNKLTQEMVKNFQNKNIGLLEFMDFYDSYKENTLQMNELKLNKSTALEEINYVTGTSIFK